MTRVAIVGAGAIARACAAILARGGHRPALWSPRGRGLADLPDADSPDGAIWPDARWCMLKSDGAVAGQFVVAALARVDSLREAEAVIVTLPATAYVAALTPVAAVLSPSQWVLFSGALSLAPLWLAERVATAAGAAPPIASLGTTIATARTRPGGVAVMTVRTRVDIAATPAHAIGALAARCAELFDDRFDVQPSALAIALSNINPVAHAGLALANLTRIERAENWPQYHYLTPAVARLIEALDAERCAIAAAFGLEVRPIEQHFHRSFDVPLAPLAEIAAELHRRRGGPPGPTALDTRFVLEDVPYGLAFYAALARIAGVTVPNIEAVITLLSTLYGVDLRATNPLLGELRLAGATRASLLARAAGN